MAVSVSTIVADLRTVITQLVDDLDGLHVGVSRSSLTTSPSLVVDISLVPTLSLQHTSTEELDARIQSFFCLFGGVHG